MTNAILAKDNGEPLAKHTLRCLRVSDSLLNGLPFEEEIVEKIAIDLRLALAVHDSGKAATGFQKSLEKGAPRWGHRHEILSAAFASSLQLKDEIILAVITHHKSLPSDVATEERGCLHFEDIPWVSDITPKWKALVQEWNQNIPAFTKEWTIICNELKGVELIDSIRLSPLSINKSWFKRNGQPQQIPFERRYYASLLRGLLISSDHIASNNSINIEFMPFKIPVLKKYDIMQTNLRGFQKRAGDNLGNLILRSPTGSGKTLAAILWAQINQKKNGRLFYTLPNIASINSMYLRLKEYFHDYVGILHSRVASAIYSLRETDDDLNSKITNQRLAKIVNSLSREMWFPIRVCTPHQILRYTLQGKGWETMLSEFPNSCFIFDEIHAYDPTVTGLTLATAKFLKTQNASCLFLSATMPTFIRKILEDEIQSITFLEPSKDDSTDRDIIDQKRHSLEIIDGDMVSNIDTIIKESEKAKSTLIVCNHVPSAQKIYDEIQKRIGNTVLLHSRFCRRDRNKIEYQIRKSLPKVLVSTQVVEVSLDIDFEQGFSEPAPIDALVQRLGRINRFGRQKQPATVRIFRDQLHHFNIYDSSITTKSLRELQSVSNPLREQDLIEAADRVYVNGYNEENRFLYEQALNHPRIKKFEELLVSGTSRNWIDDVMRKSDSTIDMLPESLLKEYEKLEKKDLKIEAYNLLVPVPIRVMHYMNEVIDKTQDPWIIKMPYSEKIGLSLDKNIEE